MTVSPTDDTRHARPLGPWRDAVLGLTALSCGTVLLCLLIYNNDGFTRHVMSSDALSATIFVWDVLNHDYAWSGFQLARIPSIVPDLMATAILTLALGNFRWVLFAYSVLQSLAFFVAAGHLIAKVTDARALDAANMLLIVLTIVLVIDFCFPAIAHHRTIFSVMEHFGPFLLSIAGMLLTLRLFKRTEWVTAGGLFVCCFFGFLSSRLFAFDYGVPLVAALATLSCVGLLRWRRATEIAGYAGAGFLLAAIADRYLLREPDIPITDAPRAVHRRDRFVSEADMGLCRCIVGDPCRGADGGTRCLAAQTHIAWRRRGSGRGPEAG
jgi:hypothetical protein